MVIHTQLFYCIIMGLGTSSGVTKGTWPLSKVFFVQYKLYRYLSKYNFLKFDANEFLWMRFEYHP